MTNILINDYYLIRFNSIYSKSLMLPLKVEIQNNPKKSMFTDTN